MKAAKIPAYFYKDLRKAVVKENPRMSGDNSKHGMGEPDYEAGGGAYGTFAVTNDEISEVTR
jgi:hypothetical protein